MKSVSILNSRKFSVIFAIVMSLMASTMRGSLTVYQDADSTNNFVPDADDGTPNRPAGEIIGNTITLAETHCSLTGATIKIATTDTATTPQDVTLSLYLNDGASDPGGSVLLQPGTLITSVTVSQVSLSSGVLTVDFSFPSLLVPDTFTFVLSFSPGGASSSSFVGAMSANSAPQIGSGFNTLWYGNGAIGNWTTNSSWALADGAAVNFLDATFLIADPTAVPEPPATFFLAMSGAIIWLKYKRFRRI